MISFRALLLPQPVFSLCRRFAASKGGQSSLAVNVLTERGPTRRRARRVNDTSRDFEKKGYVAVAPAKSYDLRKVRTAVRESKSFAIAEVLPSDVGTDFVLPVREFLAGGRQRNCFIFSFGAVVVCDVTDGETACSPHLERLLSEIGARQDSPDTQWLDYHDYVDIVVDDSRRKSGIVDETVYFCESGTEGALWDQLAVAHGLALSLKLRSSEVAAEDIKKKCLLLCSPASKKWYNLGGGKERKMLISQAWTLWETASAILDKANHELEDSQDIYWDYPAVEILFEDVLHRVLDYKRRLRKVNANLNIARSLLRHVRHNRVTIKMYRTSLAILFALSFAVVQMTIDFFSRKSDQ